MHGRTQQRATAEMGFAEPDPPIAQQSHPLLAHPEGGLGNEHLLGRVEFVDRAFICLRKLHGAADDRGEHGVQVERGVHRAQHLLQRLEFGDRAGQRCGTFLQGREGRDAADSDDRLFREGLQQPDLTVGESAAAGFPVRPMMPIAAPSRSRGTATNRTPAVVLHGRARSGSDVTSGCGSPAVPGSRGRPAVPRSGCMGNVAHGLARVCRIDIRAMLADAIMLAIEFVQH